MTTNTMLVRANLRAHGRRFVSTGLAVAISTAFIAITMVVMGGLVSQLGAGVTDRYANVTAVVSFNPNQAGGASLSDLTDQARTRLHAVPGVRAVSTYTQWPAEAQANGARAFFFVSPLMDEPLRRPALDSGDYPTGPGQILLPDSTATLLGVKAGGTVTARPQFDGIPAQDLTVTGVYSAPSSNSGMAAAYTTEAGFTALMGSAPSGTLMVATDEAGDDNGNPPAAEQERWASTIRNSLSGLDGVDVTTAKAAMESDLEQAHLGGAAMTAMLMIFPAVAALVASIVVSSTFRVVLQQRRRELALLRTLGATRAQVRRLVTLEALAIGAFSSLIGTAAGTLLGAGALTVMNPRTGYAGALASADYIQLALVWAAATVFTAAVGLFPALSASRVPPIAALAPVNEAGAGARKSHTARLVIGALIAVGALAGVWAASGTADTTTRFLAMFGLSLLAFFGLILAFSVVLPPLTRLLGAAWPGMLARMARENTMRNPGRTSATGSAIVIGVALVVTMMVGASSLRETLTTAVDDARPFDLGVASNSGGPLAQDVEAKVAATNGVAATAPEYAADGTAALPDGSPALPSSSAPGSANAQLVGQPDYTAVAHSHVEQLDDQTARVGVAALDGTRLTVCGSAGSCLSLTASYSDKADPDQVMVSASNLAAIAPDRALVLVIAKLSDGADAQEVQSALLTLDPSLRVDGSALERQTYMRVIDQVLMAVIALLGVSVIVSLVGVANTLSLSVVERTRENGLLRALGLTKRQMKRLLALEALCLSVTGALVGLGMGVLFGWLGVLSVPLDDITPVLVLPWAQIGAVLVVAVLSALVASWLPGRRAARVSPAEALATE